MSALITLPPSLEEQLAQHASQLAQYASYWTYLHSSTEYLNSTAERLDRNWQEMQGRVEACHTAFQSFQEQLSAQVERNTQLSDSGLRDALQIAETRLQAGFNRSLADVSDRVSFLLANNVGGAILNIENRLKALEDRLCFLVRIQQQDSQLLEHLRGAFQANVKEQLRILDGRLAQPSAEMGEYAYLSLPMQAPEQVSADAHTLIGRVEKLERVVGERLTPIQCQLTQLQTQLERLETENKSLKSLLTEATEKKNQYTTALTQALERFGEQKQTQEETARRLTERVQALETKLLKTLTEEL